MFYHRIDMSNFFRFILGALIIYSCQNVDAVVVDFQTTYQEILDRAFELKAASARVDAKTAEQWQAAAIPNPELAVTLETIGRDVDGNENELTIGLNQLVELGGKRAARIRVASAEQYIKRCDVEIVKSDLSNALLHAFINTAAAQE